MKHGEGKDEARDLYCYGQCTFDEISRRTGRSEKTIRGWAESGDWKQARNEILSARISTREKLYSLVDKIADRMIRDADGDVDLSPQSLHALTNLVSAVKNMYAYESSKAKNEEPTAERDAATPEDIYRKVAEIMGA